MLSFIRSDLSQFTAYKPHTSSNTALSIKASTENDRLDANESPYDLPSPIKEKLAWIYQQSIETNRYPDGGHQLLKQAIAEYVNESANSANTDKSNFTAENISIGNGSDELIRSLFIATCLGGEGSVLIANPTFVMYGILAKTLGIPVVDALRNPETFEIDIKAAQAAVENTHPNIRVVCVVHPNSPTGNPLTEKELAWLKNLPENILVVIDEAYFEFSQNTLAVELTQHPNWVILRTFSKAFRLAAMRVGYCIAHPELIAILEKVRLPYNIPSFSLSAALIAMQNRQLVLNSIPQTLSERSKLIETLSKNPMLKVWDSAANFVFLRLTHNQVDSQESIKTLHQKLKQNGTLVREINGGLRITVGTPEENLRTINNLQTALKNL